MTSDQIKEILNNRLINAAAVAVQVLPNLKENSAKKTFLMKLAGAKFYTLTDADQNRTEQVIKTFAAELSRTNATENSITEILSNPILKRSAIAEQIYKGFTPKAASANFANKLKGTRPYFTEAERVQIAEILQDLSRTIEARMEPAEQEKGGRDNFLEILNGGKIDPNIFLPKKRDVDQED